MTSFHVRYKTLENVVIIDLCHKNQWMNMSDWQKSRQTEEASR